mgnify:FL=1
MLQTFLLATLDGVAQASVSFMVAVGLSLVFGTMRILNIAHGSLYALGGYTAAAAGLWLSATWGDGPWLYLVLVLSALFVGVPLGALIERVMLRRIYGQDHTLQLLITFGIFMILEDVQKLIFGVEPYFNDAPLAMLGVVEIVGIYYTTYQLVVLPLAALATMLSLAWFFNRTRKGKLITAVIEDFETASVMGVNAQSVYFWTFVLGTTLAALGGALASPTTSLVPGTGAGTIVLSFAIVASAGLGHFQGAAVTALLIGLAQAFSVHFYSNIAAVMPYLVMTLILILKPYGLFGKPEVIRI